MIAGDHDGVSLVVVTYRPSGSSALPVDCHRFHAGEMKEADHGGSNRQQQLLQFQETVLGGDLSETRELAS